MRTFLKQVGLVIMGLGLVLAVLAAFAWSSDGSGPGAALDATLFSVAVSSMLGGGVLYLLGSIAEDVDAMRRRGEE